MGSVGGHPATGGCCQLSLSFPSLAVINALSQRYFLQASDQKDLQDWVEALNRASKITVGYLMLFSVVPSTIPRDPCGWGLLVYLPSPSQPSCGGTAAVPQGGPVGAVHIPSCSRPSSSCCFCWLGSGPASSSLWLSKGGFLVLQ